MNMRTVIWINTTGTIIESGRIITIFSVNDSPSTDVGSASRHESFSLSTSGDSVSAYVGTLNDPSAFLTVYSTNTYSDQGITLPTGIVDGLQL